MLSESVLEIARISRIKGLWKCDLKVGRRRSDLSFGQIGGGIEKIREDTNSAPQLLITKVLPVQAHSSVMPVKAGRQHAVQLLDRV